MEGSITKKRTRIPLFCTPTSFRDLTESFNEYLIENKVNCFKYPKRKSSPDDIMHAGHSYLVIRKLCCNISTCMKEKFHRALFSQLFHVIVIMRPRASTRAFRFVYFQGILEDRHTGVRKIEKIRYKHLKMRIAGNSPETLSSPDGGLIISAADNTSSCSRRE